jgi:hypothetical protein
MQHRYLYGRHSAWPWMERDRILLGCCQRREAVDNFFSCCRGAGRSAATESAGRAGRIPCHKSKTENYHFRRERDDQGIDFGLIRSASPNGAVWPSGAAALRVPPPTKLRLAINPANQRRTNHHQSPFCTYIHGFFCGRRGRRAAAAPVAAGRR